MAQEQRHIMFEPGEVQAQQETLFSHGYTFIRELGAGGFSKVCLVHSQRYKEMEFAAKISFRNKGETARQTAEVKMLHQIDHPNIIRIYDYFYDEKYVYTILEYCPNGSLLDMIRSNAIGRYDTMLQHMRGIASALALCHKQGIAHRDIKPANVLIDNYGRCKRVASDQHCVDVIAAAAALFGSAEAHDSRGGSRTSCVCGNCRSKATEDFGPVECACAVSVNV